MQELTDGQKLARLKVINDATYELGLIFTLQGSQRQSELLEVINQAWKDGIELLHNTKGTSEWGRLLHVTALMSLGFIAHQVNGGVERYLSSSILRKW